MYFSWSPQGTSLASMRILQATARGRRDRWGLSLLSDSKPGEGGEKGFWFGSQLRAGAAEDTGSHSACDALLQLTLNESFSGEGSSLPSSSRVSFFFSWEGTGLMCVQLHPEVGCPLGGTGLDGGIFPPLPPSAPCFGCRGGGLMQIWLCGAPLPGRGLYWTPILC